MIVDRTGIVRAEGNGLDIRMELDKLAKSSGRSGADTPGSSQHD